MRNSKQNGFTLIELMVVIAIVGILASIAYPSYTSYIIKGNRSAAQAQMLDIANRQQQFLLANRAFASTTTLNSRGYALPSTLTGKYTHAVEVGTGTVTSFTITFTATGNKTSDGNITLNSDGVKSPAAKW